MEPDLELFPDTRPDPERGADIDETGRYRWLLWRGPQDPDAWRCLFVMLNPSTADAIRDDQTVRQCNTYAQREAKLRGHDRATLEIVNLFALRSSDPDELARAHAAGVDVVGPLNDAMTASAVGRSSLVVVAWGGWNPSAAKYRTLVDDRAAYALAVIDSFGRRPFCLGLTKGRRRPKHPARLGHDVPLIPYTP